jgi:hypothetical protein
MLPSMQVMTNMSTLDQLLLAALLLEAHYSGNPECSISDIAARAATLWKTRQYPSSESPSQTDRAPGQTQAPSKSSSTMQGASGRLCCTIPEAQWLALHADGLPAAAIFLGVQRLEACNLVLVGSRAARWQSVLALNVATDDAAHVLKNSSKIAWIRDVLSAVV